MSSIFAFKSDIETLCSCEFLLDIHILAFYTTSRNTKYQLIPSSYLIIHAGIQSDLDLLLQDFSHKYSVLLLNVVCLCSLAGYNEKECRAKMTLHTISRSIVCTIHHINTFLQIWIIPSIQSIKFKSILGPSSWTYPWNVDLLQVAFQAFLRKINIESYA